MIKILFICHGNICRSPMAEFLFRHIVNSYDLGSQFYIASAATSAEELGNPVHPETKRILSKRGISTYGKVAVRLTKADYQSYDFLIGMDHRNYENILRITNGDPQKKVHLMLEFTAYGGEVADPWYTGNFNQTIRDIEAGCRGLLCFLLEQTKEELIDNGALYIRKLKEGFETYSYQMMTGSADELLEKLCTLREKNGITNSFVDFYYGILSKEEQSQIQQALSPECLAILKELPVQKKVRYFSLTDEILLLTAELNEKELLFCTYYFLKTPCTVWGNYNHSYPVFYKNEDK